MKLFSVVMIKLFSTWLYCTSRKETMLPSKLSWISAIKHINSLSSQVSETFNDKELLAGWLKKPGSGLGAIKDRDDNNHFCYYLK